MDNLDTLKALLGMTRMAQEMAADKAEPQRLRSVMGSIRRRARLEQHGLSRVPKEQLDANQSRFHLCMVRICVELNFGSIHIANSANARPRLERVREEIERAIKEVGGNHFTEF